MGMAASQARFLGLTARKSNVEYQGQQVNQQRASLANESSNLYTQMMTLDVPVPPAENDFYKTTYVLDGTGDGYSNGDYEIVNLTKSYEKDGQYLITLAKDVEKSASKVDAYTFGSSSDSVDADGNNVKTIRFRDEYNANSLALNYVTNSEGKMPSAYNEYGQLDNVTPYQIYEMDLSESAAQPVGYEICKNDEESDDPIKYFYQDSSGQNHFLTQGDLDSITGKAEMPEGNMFGFFTQYSYAQSVTTQVNAYLEQSSNGRYTAVTIEENEDYPVGLSGRTFSLSAVREKDEEGYNQAYSDYEYNKDLYEKSIANINAQTAMIQKKDQQLELRLEQLDTEQNAISTEMEAVQKVIEDNIENTFKIFA